MHLPGQWQAEGIQASSQFSSLLHYSGRSFHIQIAVRGTPDYHLVPFAAALSSCQDVRNQHVDLWKALRQCGYHGVIRDILEFNNVAVIINYHKPLYLTPFKCSLNECYLWLDIIEHSSWTRDLCGDGFKCSGDGIRGGCVNPKDFLLSLGGPGKAAILKGKLRLPFTTHA